jgi:hypothetical protein
MVLRERGERGGCFGLGCGFWRVSGSRFSVSWAYRGAEERKWVGEGRWGRLVFGGGPRISRRARMCGEVVDRGVWDEQAAES